MRAKNKNDKKIVSQSFSKVLEFKKDFSFYNKPEFLRFLKKYNKSLNALGYRNPFIDKYVKEESFSTIYKKYDVYDSFNKRTLFARTSLIQELNKDPLWDGGFPLNSLVADAFKDLKKRGADINRIKKILRKYIKQFNAIPKILVLERKAKEIAKIVNGSRKRYLTLRNIINTDAGFSKSLKKTLTKELNENINILDLTKELISSIRYIRADFGITKKTIKIVEKNKLVTQMAIDIREYLNGFFQTDINNNAAYRNTTHERALKATANILKGCFPEIWVNVSIEQLANRIKQYHH